jgi:hypothetical protein
VGVEKETEKMKRILMMLALAAFLVAALSVSALSAFAAGPCGDINNNGHKCVIGGGKPSAESNGAVKKLDSPQKVHPQDR